MSLNKQALAVYLCSNAAAQITGANLPIDGGWTAAQGGRAG
jgi:3-hydroxybutyrate dehydrogenase